MQIAVNKPVDDPEVGYYANEVVIDEGGVDLVLANGERYSGNWGDSEAHEVGAALIYEQFKFAGMHDREHLLNSARELVKLMEANLWERF